MVSVRAVIGAALLAVSLTGGSQGAAAQSAPEPTHHGVAFIRDALSEAAAFGDRSLIASVVENARLTPQRSGAIADAAIALRPDLAASIERAISAGRNLADTWPAASVSLQAGQSAGAPPAAPFANPTPYPGGNPDIPITSLSEFDRNFSLDAIGAETALSLGFTGKGVVVGTIDTGIDIRPDGTMHPELLGRIDPRSKSYLYWFDESRLDDDDDDDFDGDDDGDGDDDDDTLAALSDAFDQGPTDSQDRDGHGTHVAGIIAAGQNGFGMQGVAPGANVIALKAITRNGRIEIDDDEYISFTNIETCGPSLFDGDCDKLYDSSAYPDAESAAFAYLAQFSDVRVINGSFGPATPDGTVTWDLGGAGEQAAILRQAQVVRGNLDAGQIVVMSAGNDRFYSPEAAQSPNGVGLYPFIRPENANATNVSGTQVYDDHGTGLDLSFTSAEALAAAEAADGKARGRIVVVVALDAYNELALYSEECGVTAEWCVAAPGGGVDGYGFPPPEGGRGIYSTVPEDSYGFKSGTSMAAPNVAGAIAVLIEAYPTFTPAEIVHILFTTAEDLGAPGVDPIFGWGLVRLDRALSVGPVGMSGTGTYTVGAGGSDTTWLVDFTSQGGLEKTGAGTLTVASAATFQKASTVSGGTLSVGGTLTTPSLSVDQGATLSGTGSVAADITVAGRLAPGNSPGTLLVTGDVTLASTATTLIEIDGTGTGSGAGNFDRIVVDGAGSVFTAGGTLEPVLRGISAPATNTFTPTLGQGFVFVEAPSVAGSFDALTQPVDGLPSGTRFDVMYSPTALALAVTPLSYADLSAVGVGQTANERALGAAIDAARPAAGVRPSSDAANTLFNVLYPADAAALDAGLPTLTGQIHSEMGTAAVRAVGRFADTLGQRQMGLAADRLAARGTPYGAGEAWASVEGTATDVGSANGLAGYDVRATSGAAGADWRPGFGALGFALSYEYADLSGGTAGSGDADTYQGGLYATLGAGPVALALRGGLAYGELSTARTTSLGSYSATASTDGHGFGGFAEATAFRAFDTPAVTLTPSATLGWRGFHRSSVDETGSAFALSLPGQTFEETQTTLALAVSKRFVLDNGLVLEPVASVGWRHDFSDLDEAARLGLLGASFEADGAEIGSDAFLGRIDLTAMATDRFAFGASYQAEIRDNLTGHTFSAEASFRF